MKKLIAAAACSVLMLPTASFAKTLIFPSDNPVAQITMPDSWDPEETESGIQGTSDDGAIYISIDVASDKTSDKVIDDALDFLKDNGVTVDPKSQKESDDEVNGMKMSNLDWDGSDKDGPVNIGLSFLSPRAGKLLVVTYWGSKGDQEKHGKQLVSIINSLKPASK